MNDYTESLTITLAASLIDVANALARSFDPDSGGADTYRLQQTGTEEDGTPIYDDTISMTTPCTPEFKAQSAYLMDNPQAMHGAVLSDYAARWPDLTPPTLEDCVSFCASAKAHV